MISAADLLYPTAGALAPLPTATSATGQASSSWFDDTTTPALCIGADLDAASRGLSVAQHAEQVLGHLRGEPEEG